MFTDCCFCAENAGEVNFDLLLTCKYLAVMPQHTLCNRYVCVHILYCTHTNTLACTVHFSYYHTWDCSSVCSRWFLLLFTVPVHVIEQQKSLLDETWHKLQYCNMWKEQTVSVSLTHRQWESAEIWSFPIWGRKELLSDLRSDVFDNNTSLQYLHNSTAVHCWLCDVTSSIHRAACSLPHLHLWWCWAIYDVTAGQRVLKNLSLLFIRI